MSKFMFRDDLQSTQRLMGLGADLSPPEAGVSSPPVTCGIYDGHDFLRLVRLSIDDTVIQSTLRIILTDTAVN
jgi:hypothetical protein